MAISTISYSDKSDINTSSTPITNKVSAADMNEIKNVVNTNANTVGDTASLNTTSSTIVGAINEVKSDFSWKLLGSVTGDVEITLPNNFIELLVIVNLNNVDYAGVPINIPYINLGASPKGYNNGYYGSGVGQSSMARIYATTTKAHLEICYVNGTDMRSTTTSTYYYR